TLHTTKRINIHHKYELIVHGTGAHAVSNTEGQLLDGSRSGKPGSDYRTSLTWRELVLARPQGGVSNKKSARKLKLKSELATHDVKHGPAPITRPSAFRR